MSGRRLLIGLLVMGIAVPAIVGYFLELASATAYFIVAVTTFLGWGIADLAADILGRPRLANRSPRGAIRDIDMGRGEEKDPSI